MLECVTLYFSCSFLFFLALSILHLSLFSSLFLFSSPFTILSIIEPSSCSKSSFLTRGVRELLIQWEGGEQRRRGGGGGVCAGRSKTRPSFFSKKKLFYNLPRREWAGRRGRGAGTSCWKPVQVSESRNLTGSPPVFKKLLSGGRTKREKSICREGWKSRIQRPT